MSAKWIIWTGVAGLTAMAGLASPAAGQYYPPPPNPQGGLTGAIIDQVLGYGRYPHGNYGYNQYGSQRMAIDQCARAVEARLNRNTAYGNWGYRGQNYNRYRNSGRVEGITRIDRKKYGLKVWGVASSGWGGYDGWNRPGYGNYGYGAGADLRFDCEVRHDGRIRKLDIKRRTANWRGY